MTIRFVRSRAAAPAVKASSRKAQKSALLGLLVAVHIDRSGPMAVASSRVRRGLWPGVAVRSRCPRAIQVERTLGSMGT